MIAHPRERVGMALSGRSRLIHGGEGAQFVGRKSLQMTETIPALSAEALPLALRQPQ